MFNLRKLFTTKQQPCDNFNGIVQNVIKGGFHHLIGKCTNCNNDFADHSFIRNACPVCGKKQMRQRGSIQQPFGKKHDVIKFTACDCLIREGFGSKYSACEETPLYEKISTKTTQQNFDQSVNIIYTNDKLPPLNVISLSKTKFCACKNICEYDLSENAYKPECRNCRLMKQKKMSHELLGHDDSVMTN